MTLAFPCDRSITPLPKKRKGNGGRAAVRTEKQGMQSQCSLRDTSNVPVLQEAVTCFTVHPWTTWYCGNFTAYYPIKPVVPVVPFSAWKLHCSTPIRVHFTVNLEPYFGYACTLLHAAMLHDASLKTKDTSRHHQHQQSCAGEIQSVLFFVW